MKAKMSKPKPEFHKIDVQRLIEAAQGCGLQNYKLVIEGRKLSMVITEGDKKPIEFQDSSKYIETEIEPVL